MVTLHRDDRLRIADAIARAERRSRGEIMVAVTPQSGDWRGASLAFSAGVSFAAVLMLWLMRPQTAFPLLWIFQIALLLLSEAVMSLTGWEAALVPDAAKEAAARRHAHALFYRHGLHRTPLRAVILIFISLEEHVAELVMDEGIQMREEPDVWDGVLSRLGAGIRAGKTAAALAEAVDECGLILQRHFPGNPPGNAVNRGDLPDLLVMESMT